MQSATDAILALPEGTRVMVTFPLPLSARVTHALVVDPESGVYAEDAKVRANRYALLARLRGLFLGVADISLLG